MLIRCSPFSVDGIGKVQGRIWSASLRKTGYFRDSYPRWREKTALPKFGWSGFGTHNESPMKLLWAPEREQVLRAAELTALLPGFVSFWTEETADLFQREYPEIPIEDYFTRVRNDSAWCSANKGTVVPELKGLLEGMPQPFGAARARHASVLAMVSNIISS
jgi:hypothetical protein